jgi:RNA polymerase sigma-70 factor (ECF subfamily)
MGGSPGTGLCLDRMKSAQARREAYVGPWLPDPVLAGSALAPPPSATLADDLSFALLLTLERPSPLERAAFLLHDVFDMDFREIADALERSETSCRQLASRARSRVRRERPRFRPSREECERLSSAFARAAASRDTAALACLLAEHVVLLSDGGGRVPAALRPVAGRDRVARLVAGLAAKVTVSDIRVSPARVNGLPGFVFSDTSGRSPSRSEQAARSRGSTSSGIPRSCGTCPAEDPETRGHGACRRPPSRGAPPRVTPS